jgi:hypothetical protein
MVTPAKKPASVVASTDLGAAPTMNDMSNILRDSAAEIRRRKVDAHAREALARVASVLANAARMIDHIAAVESCRQSRGKL